MWKKIVLFFLFFFFLKNHFLNAEKIVLKGYLEKEDYFSKIVFTGSNFLRLTNYSSFELGKNFTIEVWCKPEILDGGYLILKKYSFGFPCFLGEGKVSLYLKTKKGEDKSYIISNICKVNEWQHYVLTYDGEKVSVFYNGELVSKYNLDEEINFSKEPILIANSEGWRKNNFKGKVGIIRIFNYALDEKKIKEEYLNLSTGKESNDFDGLILEVPKRDSYYLFNNQELQFLIPKWDLKNKSYLYFEGRIETGGWLKSGSATSCIILVNNVPLFMERLVNKKPYYFFTSEERVFWFDENKNAWVFPYYEWNDKSKGEHIHKFVFDISDLMKEKNNFITFKSIYIYGGEDNKPIEIRNIYLFSDDTFDKSPDLNLIEPPYISKGLEYFRKKAKSLHKGVNLKLNAEEKYNPNIGFVSPTKTYYQNYTFQTSENGLIKLIFKDKEFKINSAIRFKDENDWRYVGKEEGNKWDFFKISDKRINCGNKKILLEREIIKKDTCLEIHDTYKNITDEDQPVVFVNMIDLGNIEEIKEFRIAGKLKPSFFVCSNPMIGRDTISNPTAFVGFEKLGIGIVLEDDVYRVQGTWMTWDSTLAVGSDLFYLNPKKSYTFVWKIYPLTKPDYYELLNKVRHDWNLYQQIPGLFGFVHPYLRELMYEDVKYTTPEDRGKFVEETGIKIASTALKYIDPEGKELNILGGEPIEIHRKASDKFVKWREDVKSMGKDVKCLPYLNIHLVRLLPRETIEDIKKRFPDGIPVNAWGQPYAYRTGWLYCILPQLNNKVGEHMMELLKLYMDELKFDGIYLDEFDFSRAKVSFGHQDGFSAILDENCHIIRKIGFVPLLVKNFQVTFAKEIIKRNGLIFANQFPSTLETAQLPIIFFAEPVTYDSDLLYSAQISRTPLSLHLKPRVNLFENIKEFLKKGILTCYYWYYLHGEHILKQCYPITVKEIYPGVIIGENKIITCCSGRFTFERNKPLTVYVYEGPDGLLKEKYEIKESKNLNYTYADIQLKENQIAVIVEK